jgi:hypothetical protein
LSSPVVDISPDFPYVPIVPETDSVTNAAVARALALDPKTLRSAIVQAGALAPEARDARQAALARAWEARTPGGHVRWTRASASEVVRAFGRQPPKEWVTTGKSGSE